MRSLHFHLVYYGSLIRLIQFSGTVGSDDYEAKLTNLFQEGSIRISRRTIVHAWHIGLWISSKVLLQK